MVEISEIIWDPNIDQWWNFSKLFEIRIQINDEIFRNYFSFGSTSWSNFPKIIWDLDPDHGQIFRIYLRSGCMSGSNFQSFKNFYNLIEYLRNLETDKLVIFSSILIVFIWMHLMIDYLCFSSKLGQSWSEQFTPGSSSVYTLQSTRYSFIQHFVIYQIFFFYLVV